MSKRTKKATRRVASGKTKKSSRKPAVKPTKRKAAKRPGKARAAGRTANWPFRESPNQASITVWRILNREDPILLVSHDAEDGTWQFLNTAGGQAPDIKDAAVVALREMVMLDPTVVELADLPHGGMAWRTAPGRPWKRALR